MLPLTFHFPSRTWQSLATAHLSASLDLPILTFHIHRTVVFSDWLLLLKINEGFEDQPRCSMYQYFVSFYGQNNSVWIYHILFIHLSVHRHSVCFSLLVIVSNAAVSISVQVLQGLLFWMSTQSCWSHGNFMFYFLRNCQTDFQRRCTILPSHQQCLGVLVSTHPCHYLLFFY